MILTLAAILLPAVLLTGLVLIPVGRVSLELHELQLDGLRVTFDRSGGFVEPLPMTEATVLADVGRAIDSVVVIQESGARFVLPAIQRLMLRAAEGAGPEAVLQLSSIEISPDSAFEIQTEEDGAHRLFLPGGDPRALTLGGTWLVDTTLVNFGPIGIGRIVIDTREPILVDFRADESHGPVTVLEEAGIDGLYLSRLRPLSDRAETTVRRGRLVADGVQETLDPSSSPSFDAFRGAVDSLWLDGGSLRAEITGEEVRGLAMGGERRMPSLLAALPPVARWVTLSVLLGSVAVGGVRLSGLGRLVHVRAPATGPSRAELPADAPAASRRLAAVWFADIVGFTELSSRDEDGALAVSGELERLTRQEVETHGGRVVKLLGDGVLTEFGSVDAAVRAALRLQAAFSGSEVVRAKRKALRIGVHVCEVVATADGDVYGSGVNIASRIESAGEPGRVTVSEEVAQQLRQRVEFALTAMEPVHLKGLDGAARLFTVDWNDA